MLTALHNFNASVRIGNTQYVDGKYVTYPSPGLVYSCRSFKKSHTPDIAYLEQFERVLLFCYGREMKNHDEHEHLGDQKIYHGTVFTEPNYVVWRKRLGKESFPIAMRTEGSAIKGHEPARLKGELYAVPPSTIIKLDNLRQNGNMFRRKRIHLVYPFREFTYQVGYDKMYPDTLKWIPTLSGQRLEVFIEAWAYVGRKTYWDEVIDMGYNFTQVNRYNPGGRFALSKEYFAFTRKEYE